MDTNRAHIYADQYKKYVRPGNKITLYDAFLNVDENKMEKLSKVKLYDPFIILITSWLLGFFGVDRFMLGDTVLGICKLLLGWLTFGVWPLFDIFFCFSKAKTKNLDAILNALK